MEYYDKLVLIWAGSAVVEPLKYGIDSSYVSEYSGDNAADESNTSTSVVAVEITMTLLLEAPVALESTVATDLTRKQEKQPPDITIMIEVIQKVTLLLRK